MKKIVRFVFLFALVGILLAGTIGLIIPFEFENFTYAKVTSSSDRATSTFDVSFELENKADKDYNNVSIVINYTTKLSGFYSFEQEEVTLQNVNLKAGKNKIEFTHSSQSSSSILVDVDTVTLTLEDGNSFEIYYYPSLFAGINLIFLSLLFVGFFGCAVITAITIYQRKKEAEEVVVKKSFNDRIKEAFAPVADTINTLKRTYEESKTRINSSDERIEKPHKVTCSYCKGKYNSNEDRCPHCGAPPEPSN